MPMHRRFQTINQSSNSKFNPILLNQDWSEELLETWFQEMFTKDMNDKFNSNVIMKSAEPLKWFFQTYPEIVMHVQP